MGTPLTPYIEDDTAIPFSDEEMDEIELSVKRETNIRHLTDEEIAAEAMLEEATAAAEARALKDPWVIEQEAATLDACRKHGASIHVVDRKTVDVPPDFCRGAPKFFVGDRTIAFLAFPEGASKIPSIAGWGARMSQRDEYLLLPAGPWSLWVHGYRCTAPGHKKLWTIQRHEHLRNKDVELDCVDVLAMNPFPVLFVDAPTAKTIAMLCHPTVRSDRRLRWVPHADVVAGRSS